MMGVLTKQLRNSDLNIEGFRPCQTQNEKRATPERTKQSKKKWKNWWDVGDHERKIPYHSLAIQPSNGQEAMMEPGEMCVDFKDLNNGKSPKDCYP
ncbi:hypothetical protein Tco_0771717 [Tanacetum coccineum]|uniref:Uncharacterized protein n=1 Tax=Tanacetum coccineum TaxID=301880 RepID=A0ABQ4ZHT0_9ASTR